MTQRFNADTARQFPTVSPNNAATVAHGLKCTCRPYEDVFTLRRWNAQGYRVKKGSKAVARVPVVYADSVEDPNGYRYTVKRRTTSALFCRCQVEKAPSGWNVNRTAGGN